MKKIGAHGEDFLFTTSGFSLKHLALNKNYAVTYSDAEFRRPSLRLESVFFGSS